MEPDLVSGSPPTPATGWLHANNCRHTSEISSSFSSVLFSTSSSSSYSSHFWQKAQKLPTTDEKKWGNVLNCGICGLDRNGGRVAPLMATSWCMSLEQVIAFRISHSSPNVPLISKNNLRIAPVSHCWEDYVYCYGHCTVYRGVQHSDTSASEENCSYSGEIPSSKLDMFCLQW